MKSGRYRAWIKQADAYYMLQRLQTVPPISGAYTCKMLFPPKIRGDLDGRAKLILDWMVSRGLTWDDRYLEELNLRWDNEYNDGHVWIVVNEHGRSEHDTKEASA